MFITINFGFYKTFEVIFLSLSTFHVFDDRIIWGG